MTQFSLSARCRPTERTDRHALSTNHGDLVPEDELLTHQIVDTFATGEPIRSVLTEKIWTIAHARDNCCNWCSGSVSTNRGVRRRRRGAEAPNSGPCGAGRRLASDPVDRGIGTRALPGGRAAEVNSRQPDRNEHAPSRSTSP